jgi:sugar/nucleoside kinase (ribokinase family)
MKPHAVYAYGVVSSSTLYSIRGSFPSPEGYAEINDFRHMTGGEAANSSIVLARLGVPVKLDGNWLGADENGKRTKALLSGYQIDTSRLLLREGYMSTQEVVFAAAGTRTIFGTYGRLLEDAAWNMPRESDITQAKVVCLDPFFARPAAPDRDLKKLFRDYQAAGGGLIIFTFGDAPVWYARPDEPVRYSQPYVIDPVDTTGGGDAFRAGIVYGFLKGWTDDKMVDFAAAVAAITCTRFPGVLNAPTYDEVSQFVSERPE